MSDNSHRQNIYIYLIKYALPSDFVEITNIRNTYIVDQNRHIYVCYLAENLVEKTLSLTVSEISDDVSCLNTFILVQILDTL